jgi:Zn-dependent peptidase ImmA (M78 family)
MSDKYQINFSSLLMPEPLPLKKPPTDYRVRSRRRLRLSIEIIVAREEILEALELFRDLKAATRGLIPTLNIGTARLNENPEEVAARERRRFNVSVEEQRQWAGLGSARRHWRKRIEACGVFTYMLLLPPDEVSGFSLIQDGLAAICVNDREPTDGSKIFTLFHEYCHLLLRKTGISDENSSNRVEKFCNQFAASFLIPRAALTDAIGDIETPCEFVDADVKHLATRFRVSNRAMAFRLEETGLAPRGFYGRRTGPWDLPTEHNRTADQQPSPVKIRIKRIGELHASTVLKAVRRGAINSFDASELIGLNPTTFPKIEAALG